jgi:hypothetical protein
MQLIESAQNMKNWYCRPVVSAQKIGINQLLEKIFLFPQQNTRSDAG